MREVRDKREHTVVLTFDSALEAHQWGTAEGDGRQGSLSSQQWGRSGDSWSGTADFDESVELARSGWEAGTADILRTVKEIESREDVIQKGYEWDVTGDFFDVGEVIQGTPECWLKPSFEPDPRVISICVNITHSSSVTAGQIKNRGAALLALVDRIQDTPGMVVDLTLYASFAHAHIAGNSEGTITMMFPVGTSPLPMQEIGFMLAHPGMFRRGCFAVLERVGGYKPAQGYGGVANLPPDERNAYSLHLSAYASENGISECNTIDGAVRWIDAQLEKLGL